MACARILFPPEPQPKAEGDSADVSSEPILWLLTSCCFNKLGYSSPHLTPVFDWAAGSLLKGELRFASWHLLDSVLQLIKQALTTWEPGSCVSWSSQLGNAVTFVGAAGAPAEP